MLPAGSGPSPEELMSFPSESKILTPPIEDKAVVLDFSVTCASGLDIWLLNASGEAISENRIFEIKSFVVMSESSNCWSKWRARSSTVFSSSRSLLLSPCSRNSPIRSTVPIMIAAIRNPPQRMSHRTGPRRIDVAARPDSTAVVWRFLMPPQMLDINFRIPHQHPGTRIQCIDGIAVRETGYRRLNLWLRNKLRDRKSLRYASQSPCRGGNRPLFDNWGSPESG